MTTNQMKKKDVRPFLDANSIYMQSDGEIVQVGFVHDRLARGEYVLLQRMLGPSEEDRRLGHNEVYIEVNDQVHSGYGGVRSIELSKDLVTITLDPAAAEKLQAGGEIQLQISGAQPDFRELHEKLALLCNNSVEFVDHLA